MSDPAFLRLAALHSPDQAQGYLFLAGILYARGITDLVSLDRIVTLIASQEPLPLTIAEVLGRLDDTTGLSITYSSSNGAGLEWVDDNA